MATTLNNQTQDLLARFLPPNTDARVISHYLCLLAESELRLRREVMELRAASKNTQLKTTPPINTPEQHAPLQSAIKSTEVKALNRQKTFSQPQPIKENQNNAAETTYKTGLKHFNAGGKANLIRAGKHFLTAATCGHVKASVALADMLYYGKHGANDFERALHYYNQAASAGDAYALYSAAYMTYHGEGVKVNKSEATKLLRTAAANGSTDAQEMLDWLRS